MPTTVVLIFLLTLALFLAARSMRRRLRQGCCGSGEGRVKKQNVQDRDPAHYTEIWDLHIDGMQCQNCASRVENALHALPGVWAQVELPRARALVRTKAPVSETALREAVRRAGYRVLRAGKAPYTEKKS